jgi:hypothetical protein
MDWRRSGSRARGSDPHRAPTARGVLPCGRAIGSGSGRGAYFAGGFSAHGGGNPGKAREPDGSECDIAARVGERTNGGICRDGRNPQPNLDGRIIANALSEAGFAIADWQVSGDLVLRSQLTPTAKSLVELLRNRCEPQIAKVESAHNRCRDFCRDTPSKWWVFLGSPYTPPPRIDCCNGIKTSKIGQYRALPSKAGF